MKSMPLPAVPTMGEIEAAHAAISADIETAFAAGNMHSALGLIQLIAGTSVFRAFAQRSLAAVRAVTEPGTAAPSEAEEAVQLAAIAYGMNYGLRIAAARKIN